MFGVEICRMNIGRILLCVCGQGYRTRRGFLAGYPTPIYGNGLAIYDLFLLSKRVLEFK